MKIERDGTGGFLLHADERELLLINNAINEICNGIRIDDFETRVGVPLTEAEMVLKTVGKALDASRYN